MNNRRLVSVLSILLLAVLFIAIGCGDGKRNSHANLRKVNPGGRPGNPADVKNKLEKLNKMEAVVNQFEAGTPIPREELATGSYTLVNVMTYVRFSNGSDETAAYAIASVGNDNILTEVKKDSVGLIAKDSDQERAIVIPRSFVIRGGAVTPAQSVIYAGALSNESKITHSFRADNGDTEVNVLTKIMGVYNNAKSIYASTLNGNRPAEISILKKADSSVSFMVYIQEKTVSGDPKKKTQNSHLQRHMVATYKFTPGGGPDANAAGAGPAQGSSQNRQQGVPPQALPRRDQRDEEVPAAEPSTPKSAVVPPAAETPAFQAPEGALDESGQPILDDVGY